MPDTRRFRLPLATLIAICLLLTFIIPAQMQSQEPLEPLYTTPADESETGEMIDETPQTWFVELSSAPAADGTSTTTLKNEKAAFRNEAKNAGLSYTERYAFDTLWNGLSIKVDRSQLATLFTIPGVKAVYPVRNISLPPIRWSGKP